MVINYAGRLKGDKIIDDPMKLVKFSWETERILRVDTPEEMKQKIVATALALGFKQGTRHPDDPPTNPVKR